MPTNLPLHGRYLAAPEELGPIVRAERERAGLMLKELAAELGVDPSMLSRAERGDSRYHGVLVRAVEVLERRRLDQRGSPAQGVSPRVSYLMPAVFGDVIDDVRSNGRLFRRELLRGTLAEFNVTPTFVHGSPRGSFEFGGDRFLVDVDEGLLYRIHTRGQPIILDHLFPRAHDRNNDEKGAAAFARKLREDMATLEQVGRDEIANRSHYLFRRPLDEE